MVLVLPLKVYFNTITKSKVVGSAVVPGVSAYAPAVQPLEVTKALRRAFQADPVYPSAPMKAVLAGENVLPRSMTYPFPKPMFILPPKLVFT